jgi:hypothetical protein
VLLAGFNKALSRKDGGENRVKANKEYCIGCDDNYYNGNNQMGIKECWHFKTAKALTKFCIGWWVLQDNASKFFKVHTNSCHTETGSFAFYDRLPEHLAEAKGMWLYPERVKLVEAKRLT